MVAFGLSYDLRLLNATGAERAEYFGSILDQIEWADEHGFTSVSLLEHHGAPDGYLPSPAIFAAAVAQRTSRMRIAVVVIAPLHDPIHLAEDLAMVDLLSRGRLAITLVGGYSPSDFQMFGKRTSDRPTAIDETVAVLSQAWSGEPFPYRGTVVHVTPRPFQEPRPAIVLGGMSRAAARRAARIADAYAPIDSESYEEYRIAMRELGKPDPGPCPPRQPTRFIHIAEDPELAWTQVALYWIHHMNHYAQIAAEGGVDTGFCHVDSLEELRTHTQSYGILTPQECVELAQRLGDKATLSLHPLCGGLPPDIGWESLRLIESKVLPELLRS